MKLLIIDDNHRLTDRIKKQLGFAYVIDTVPSGEQGVQQATAVGYDLIVLDLNLPDIPGHLVCKLLRERQIAAPILILTAMEDSDTKVRLLDAGADDYLTKPFNVSELHARIRALLRRPARLPEGQRMVVDDLELDLASRQVRRAGEDISLRRKEFDILEYLVLNRGRAVTRNMIIEHAWEDGASGWNNSVDVHIKHLRDKIDRPFGRRNIRTAYGVGYVFDIQER